MQGKETRGWGTPEFILVVVMLATLILLVFGVLLVPITVPERDTTTKFTDVLDYRKSILAVIIAAFGAWVGAGAAYFFGRENLKETAASLLAMREPSARQRLRGTLVRDLRLRDLGWTVTMKDSLKSVMDKLEAHPEYGFVTVVSDTGSLETVVEEEAFWRFVNAQVTSEENKKESAEKAHDAAMGLTVKEVLEDKELRRFRDRYVRACLDGSVGVVYAAMQDKGVLLAIVLDEEGKPTHYFTTAEVQRVLLLDR